MSKPREFILLKNTNEYIKYTSGSVIFEGDTHVIEKSAYDELQERLREITSEWENACERADYERELIQDHLDLQQKADKLAEALDDSKDLKHSYISRCQLVNKALKEYRGEPKA